MHLYILFHTGFHYGFSQDVECSSLCCTVGPSLFLMRNSCIFFFPAGRKSTSGHFLYKYSSDKCLKYHVRGQAIVFSPLHYFSSLVCGRACPSVLGVSSKREERLGVFDANAWFPSCALSLKEPQGGPSLVPDLLSAHQSWREVGGVDPVLIFSRFKV